MLLRPGPVPKRKKHTILVRERLARRKARPSFIQIARNSQGNARMDTFSKNRDKRNVYESGCIQAGPLQTLELAWALMWHQKANTTKSLTGELSAPELRLDIGNKGSQGIKIVPSQLFYLIACRNFRRLSFLHLQLSLGKKKMMTLRNPLDAAKVRLAQSLYKFDTILSGVIIFLRTTQ